MFNINFVYFPEFQSPTPFWGSMSIQKKYTDVSKDATKSVSKDVADLGAYVLHPELLLDIW